MDPENKTAETPAATVTPMVPAAPQPGSPEYAARVAANAPANVPAKFKNPDGTVNLPALTEAYRQLEVKQSTQPKADAPKADAATAVTAKTETASLDEAFKAADAPRVNLWATAQAELAAEGKISDVTRAGLKTAHNADDNMIDGMVAGYKAQRSELGRNLAAVVGGQENLNKVIAYAKVNMDPAALTDLRKSLETPMGPLVLAGLNARMQAASPAAAPAVKPAGEPKSILDTAVGGDSKSGGTAQPFATYAEFIAAYRDPRYLHGDQEFQKLVAARTMATQQAKR